MDEDKEDLVEARRRLATGNESLPYAEVRKRLGLDKGKDNG